LDWSFPLEEDLWFQWILDYGFGSGRRFLVSTGYWILVVFGIQEDFGFKEEHMF